MKYFYSALLLFFITGHVTAETSQVSAGTPDRTEIPAVGAGLYLSADLVITEIAFVSIYFDVTSRTYRVKITVDIRNTGDIASVETQLEAYTKPTDENNSWKVMGKPVTIPVIGPGSSFSSAFSFTDKVVSVGTYAFNFRVKADPGNRVIESDERNNYSKSILINPRAY